MLSINDLKKGANITLNSEPYTVLSSQHLKMGRGGGIMQTRLRNLINGKVIDKNFKGQETVEPADLERKTMQFLYADEQAANFMDQESYETVTITRDNIEDKIPYLKEGEDVIVLTYNGQAVNAEIPAKVALKVVSTPPGDRGNTASGAATKEATLETGLKIQVPMFIKEGEVIRVNTESGQYVERAK